jgi:phage terminase small subunit
MARPTGMSTKGSKQHAATNKAPAEVAQSMLLVEVPPPNPSLNEDGIFWWTYYCGLMIESKNLSRYFIPHIHTYCMTLQAIDAFERQLAIEGHIKDVPKTFKGEEYVDEVPNPIIKDLAKLYDQLDRLGTSLGFTPYASQIQGVDARAAAENSVSEPPPLPEGLSPETLPFSQAQ